MPDGGDGLNIDVGVTLAKLQRQMATVEARMVRAATKAERAWSKANGGLGRPEEAARSAANSAEVMGRELDRLRAKYDPVFAASKRYEAALGDLNRAHKLGALNAQQHDAALERLNAEYAREAGMARAAGVAVDGAAAASLRTGRAAGAMRGQVQNAAFQIGDFATQVGAGTAASVALGQQLPQLLGGFGALGAVLGAVVAIGVPLAASFLGTGEAGKDMQERIDELKKAVDDYTAASEGAFLPTAELAKKYGTATEAAREFLGALREITKVDALDQLDATIETLSRSLGNFRETRDRGGNVREADAVRRMREDLGVAAEDAKTVARQLQDLGQAEGPKAQAEAAKAFLEAMEAALGPYDQMNDAARALYREVRDAGDEAARLAGAAEGAGSAISGAASAAGSLADELGRAVDNAVALASQGVSGQTRAKIEYDFRNDPVGGAAALARERFDSQVALPEGADSTLANVVEDQRRAYVGAAVAAEEYRQKLAAWRKEQSKASHKTSGGSRRKTKTPGLFEDADKQLLQLEREMQLLGKTGGEVARLRAEFELLDEARRRGLDLEARQAASGETLREEIARQASAIGALTEKYSQAEDRAKFFDDQQKAVKDGLLDAIVEGENLSGVLADVAKAFAKAALQAALFNEGPMAGGKGSGLLGSIFSIFTGAVGGGAPASSPRPMPRPKATGGRAEAGRVYKLGEHGPELFRPDVPGSVLTAQDTRALTAPGGAGGGAGSGGTMAIHVTVAGARGNSEIETMVERGVRQGLSAYDRALPGRIAQVRQDPRRRG